MAKSTLFDSEELWKFIRLLSGLHSSKILRKVAQVEDGHYSLSNKNYHKRANISRDLNRCNPDSILVERFNNDKKH